MHRRNTVFILTLIFAVNAASAFASPFDGRWTGDMTCGEGDSEFVSPRTIDIKAGELSYANSSQTRTNGREQWRGVVDADGDLVMTGAYAWKGAEKPVWLKGWIDSDRLEAVGVRGPKTCVLSAKRKLKTAVPGGQK